MPAVKLTDEYMKRGKALAVPGSYWDPAAGGWMAAVTQGRQAAIITSLFPEVAVAHPEIERLRATYVKDARPHDYAGELNVALDWDLPDVTPFNYQSIDTGFLRWQLDKLGGGFLHWSRGMGKTWATVALAKGLKCRRVLVVCGNTAKHAVWGQELDRVWPEAHVRVLPNEKKKRELALASLDLRTQTDDVSEPLVLVVHYEALALIAGNKGRGDGWDRFADWDLMVFDESHRLASMQPGSRSNTQLGRATMKARKHAKRALCLSGTGIMNRGDDLFGQLHFLFPTTYKSRWRDFNNRFLDFVETDYGKVCIGFKPDQLPALRKELGVFMVHRTKEDELDLPDRVEETRYVDLSPAQARAYKEIAENWVTRLDSDEVLQATSTIAQLQLLRRIATGLDAVSGKVADSTKLDHTIELIEDNPDEAFVVFSWYKAPVYALADRLTAKGVQHGIVTGDDGQEDRAEAVRRFQAGEGRVFLGTLSTLGESVNLQRASSAIFLDRAWNPATNDQAADRIYRIGQSRKVTITHLVARNTVDELRVQPVLASKAALRAAVFGGSR